MPRMPSRMPPQLGRLIVLPFATIGVLAAVLVWEIEHVGSILLSLAILGGGVVIGITVARRLRDDIHRVADHYEALLEEADEQSRRAEAANRVKDEFLATLSHELRTPLNSILGWARLLSSGKLGASQSAHAVEAIERAGWSQSRLIEGLLDMSRIVTGKFELSPRPTRVQHVVESAVAALRAAAEAKQLTLATSLDADMDVVEIDPDRLQQIVWNLVSNAIKFTPRDGHIDVSLAQDGDHFRIVVRDSGIGFTPEVAAHLFERFRQGDSSSTREFSGLGLGLGIVRYLVELHGGTVWATSAGVNRGATFEARIPMRRAAVPQIEPMRPSAIVRSLEGFSVLVVDDDEQALDFARTALEQAGAKVVTAASARQAIDRFLADRPDVIVSDVLMPGEDGIAMMREIRAHERRLGRETPAVALTALARSDDRRRMLMAGFQLHVAKPIDPLELVVNVERLAKRATRSMAS